MKRKITNLKKEKGITLVALVITIIVLIILATVAINFAFGDNGLIKRAEDARDYYANDTAYTDESLANMDAYISETLGDNDPMKQEATSITNLTEKEKTEEYTLKVVDDTTDGEEEIFYIPGGFKLAEDTAIEVDEGIVITDGTNEFVWVPVDEESLKEMYQIESTESVTLPVTLSKSNLGEEETTTNVYSNLRIRAGDSFQGGTPGTTNLREPDILTNTSYGDASTTEERGIDLLKNELGYSGNNEEILKHFAQDMVNEYTATYESIRKYGGFYIGRYELTGTVEEPTVQRNKPILTNENWYGLKKACSNVVKSQYAQSEMIYGNQWDEVMNWLKKTEFVDDTDKVDVDSSSWGNYNRASGGTGEKQTAGSKDEWSANNIYDLAGNYLEFTQEAYGNAERNLRGGDYGIAGSVRPVSRRSNSRTYAYSEYNSSRTVIYIK